MSPFATYPGVSSTKGALVPIATATRTGDSNNTFFTNIPQGYTDLMIVANLRGSRADMKEHFNIGINGQTGIYGYTRLYVNGNSTVVSDRGSSQTYYPYLGYVPSAYATPYTYGAAVAHILNYTSSYNKIVVARTSGDLNGTGYTGMAVGLYQYTSPITQLFVSTEFTGTYGTISLYGIRSAGQ
jgi:hypothetical protein